MPQALAIPLITGAAGVASSLASQPKTGVGGQLTLEQQKELALAQMGYQDPAKRAWAEQMMGKYPEFQEGKLGPESVALARRMMGGELVPGVEKAYGAGAEREYGGMLSGLSDIGAGPSSLASARAGVMGRLGETTALAKQRAVEQGMAFAPTAYGMEMAPQLAALQKWGAEQNLFQTTPGAAYMPTAPVAPAVSPAVEAAKKKRIPSTGYGYGYQQPTWYKG
jgi:hypothetical protein